MPLACTATLRIHVHTACLTWPGCITGISTLGRMKGCCRGCSLAGLHYLWA